MSRNVIWAAAVAAMLATQGVIAAPVSPERAFNAVGSWVARGPAPSRAPTGEVRTFSLGGTNIFHFVALDKGGFVAVPCDDADSPILGFCDDGGIADVGDSSPIHDVVAAQLGLLSGSGCGAPRETGGILGFSGETAKVSVPRARAAAASPSYDLGGRGEVTWEYLETPLPEVAGRAKSGANPQTIRDETLIEHRVPILLETKWNQLTYNNTSRHPDRNCYNYYTPDNHYCGCVITAFAQIMWHHKYPADEGLGEITKECGYYSTTTNLTTIAYERLPWEDMPAVPSSLSSGASSLKQRQAIGLLCYDLGVLSQAHYHVIEDGEDQGTGCTGTKACNALKTYFHYRSAASGSAHNLKSIQNSLLANLDAGYPCAVGVPGHEVVGDGYGYYKGSLYCHLNMGWGSGGYWCLQPSNAGGASNGAINSVAAHILPTNDWRFVTGRVLRNGSPLSGATVTASVLNKDDGTVQTATATTDERGIYAIAVTNANCEVSLTASQSGCMTVTASAVTVKDSNSGSSWGNDVLLVSSSDSCIWTGAAGTQRFSDDGNWENGNGPRHFDNPAIYFCGCPAMTVTNDISGLKPASIILANGNGRIVIRGNALEMAAGGFGISSRDAPNHVFEAPVSFESGSIDVFTDSSNYIEFQSGLAVDGVGATAESVYLKGSIAVGNTSALDVNAAASRNINLLSGTTMSTGPLSNSGSANFWIDSGAELTVNGDFTSEGGGAPVGRNDGMLRVNGLLVAKKSCSASADSSSGVTVVDGIRVDATDDHVKLNRSGEGSASRWVIGSQGLSTTTTKGFWLLAPYSTQTRLTASANFSIDASIGIRNTLTLDTTDYFNPSEGRTITVNGELYRDNHYNVVGKGVVHFTRSATISGVSYIKDTATLRLDAGVSPCGGDLVMYGGTTLWAPEGGATFTKAFKVSGASSANPLNVRIGDGGLLATGTYKVLGATSVPASDPNSYMLLGNGISENGVAEFRTSGSEIYLDVTELAPVGWIEETVGTVGRTGTWNVPLEFGADGTACIADNVFEPLTASTGNVVTIDVRMTFSGTDFSANLGEDPQAAVGLGTNGSFCVLAKSDAGGMEWIEVSNAAVVPVPASEYALRVTMNYSSHRYGVAVLDGDAELPLAAADGTTLFPMPTEGIKLSRIDFVGDTEFRSMLGKCEQWLVFSPGDVVCVGGTVTLTAAKADWLNALGSYAEVSGRVAALTAEGFDKAYLLNLDVTQDGWGGELRCTSVDASAAADGKSAVSVGAALTRTHAVQRGGKNAPINGRVRLYSLDLASGNLTLVGEAAVDDSAFAHGDTATFTFETDSSGQCYKAVIGE